MTALNVLVNTFFGTGFRASEILESPDVKDDPGGIGDEQETRRRLEDPAITCVAMMLGFHFGGRTGDHVEVGARERVGVFLFVLEDRHEEQSAEKDFEKQ